jgi:hypothetical protein
MYRVEGCWVIRLRQTRTTASADLRCLFQFTVAQHQCAGSGRQDFPSHLHVPPCPPSHNASAGTCCLNWTATNRIEAWRSLPEVVWWGVLVLPNAAL